MADNKKYYYLKLKDNFFDSTEIKVLESMNNGYKYSNLLLKLYLKALKYNGALRLNELIPYNLEMLAAVTGMDIDTIKVAFDLFQKLKLIEVLDDGTIYMLEIQNFIGESSTEADRKRQYRLEIENKKKNLLPDGQMSRQMSDKNPPEIREQSPEIREQSSDSSSEKIEEEEGLKEIMLLCQRADYKLRKVDANKFIESYGIEKVKAAIVTATSTVAFEQGKIKSYKSYLASILNDLSKDKKVDITITKESKKDNFNNFKQRDLDIKDIEENILGWH